ncbi:hypothetical protein H6F93_01255 [Leptolyngbya sp. FACHB-671]|uniref:hypothetical protein n=1 Tax=Leptolyngbya sp. FACHB-671 TaxID=2692812 RepID=UPI001684CD60|nr:hypothetical protein [Leptolyngbya sp. FACHB-671]MBD2066166.1 hypothetical protein [Leptolyngbya sp. FACHB-671]
MNSSWKRVLISCAIAAVLMLGIPYAGTSTSRARASGMATRGLHTRISGLKSRGDRRYSKLWHT